MKIRLALVLSFIASAVAATLPHAGKWKVNLDKSDFGQTTLTLEQLSGGEWQATNFGVTYKFKMDGKDYPDGIGGTAAWKSGDANTWQMVTKANGKVVGTETFTLSANGKTLTDSVKQIKADGGALQSTSVYERVSGDSSLAGKWKTRKVSGAAGTIEFIPSGTDGLIFKNAEVGLSCNAKLDGKDYPCSGPMLPPGFTIALTTAGRSLNLTVKKDGKPYLKATQTVAADGKTMTETGFPAGTDETFKLVYDRL